MANIMSKSYNMENNGCTSTCSFTRFAVSQEHTDTAPVQVHIQEARLLSLINKLKVIIDYLDYSLPTLAPIQFPIPLTIVFEKTI